MRQRRTRLLVALWALGLAPSVRCAEPQPEVVVAIRYLQPTGTSHSHLYLYREDGKLLRQLTKDDTGQDTNPVFAPDGETIVFTREIPKAASQCWSIEPRGGNLHPLDTAPTWYAHTASSPHFARPTASPQLASNEATPSSLQRTYAVPSDDNLTLILAPAKGANLDVPNHWDVQLQFPNGTPAPIGQLTGYHPDLLTELGAPLSPRFWTENTVALGFCSVHLDSTAGDTVYALDVAAKRVVQLSPNGSIPIPLPEEKAFLAETEERYVPYGDGQHTANCSYLDRWDVATWTKRRYAQEKSAAVCLGASMYRPDLSPVVITLLRTAGTDD